VRAALAGGAVAGGGRLDEHLVRVQRAQLVHHAVVGGDDELLRVHLARRLQDAEVEPTASASATTSAGDSGCTSTLAFGILLLQASSSKALNSSCTMHEPFQNTMSAPVSRWM
jgi:hypothetical protein